MQFVVAILKKLPWATIGLFFLGLAIGLTWAYVIDPVDFVDATPEYLRADLKEDYMRMAIDSYRLNQSPDLAVQRWKNLGAYDQRTQDAYETVQNNPQGADPNVIKAYGDVVRNALIAEGSQNGDVTNVSDAASGNSPFSSPLIIGVLGIVLLGVLGTGAFYAYRLLNNRGSGEVTAVMQASEISRNAEKTNFEQLGLAPPITQTMTTYVLGDDLYDESFSIDTQAGEFMGEYGVGVSEAIGVGDPKKVTALEFWLFDKNDIKTATKVLMSQHAFNDLAVRARLEPKGELIQVEPQAQILLETATLQLLATVVDLEYGKGPMPANSYFERITLELAVWPRQA
jgi:hypothetical protein